MNNSYIKELVNIKNRLTRVEQQLSAYIDMQNERTRADIDFIAMETDVDLDQDPVEEEGGVEE